MEETDRFGSLDVPVTGCCEQYLLSEFSEHMSDCQFSRNILLRGVTAFRIIYIKWNITTWQPCEDPEVISPLLEIVFCF